METTLKTGIVKSSEKGDNLQQMNWFPKALFVLFKWVLSLFVSVRVEGIEHWEKMSDDALVVINHEFTWDLIWLALHLPGKKTFVINGRFFENRPIYQWLGWLLWKYTNSTLLPTTFYDPSFIKEAVRAHRAGTRLVINPQQKSPAGLAPVKVRAGVASFLLRTEATLLPITVYNQRLPWWVDSHRGYRKAWLGKINIHIGEEHTQPQATEARRSKQREQVKSFIFDKLCESYVLGTCYQGNLLGHLWEASQRNGADSEIFRDIEHYVFSYKDLLLSIDRRAKELKKSNIKGDYVGILLPTSVQAVVTFFALQKLNRVPCMLDINQGISFLESCLSTVKIETVIYSEGFLREHEEVTLLSWVRGKHGVSINLRDHANFSVYERMNYRLQLPSQSHPEKPAAVYFTKTANQDVKGVVYTHKQINWHMAQFKSQFEVFPEDRYFNTLPISHPIGMTEGILVPLMSGAYNFIYETSLNYRMVPRFIYDHGATFFLSVEHRLRKYAEYAESVDFSSLRVVISSAEKLMEETYQIWLKRFGIRIYQGYGQLETAPRISLNNRMYHQFKSVGRVLPGIRVKLDPAEHTKNAFKLLIQGNNVSRSFFTSMEPGVLQKSASAWEATHDIIKLDGSNYINLLGKTERFITLKNQYVALSSIESFIEQIYPEAYHAVTQYKDSSEEERLILFSTERNISMEVIGRKAGMLGVDMKAVPHEIIVVEEIPLKALGKVDFDMLIKEFVRSDKPKQ